MNDTSPYYRLIESALKSSVTMPPIMPITMPITMIAATVMVAVIAAMVIPAICGAGAQGQGRGGGKEQQYLFHGQNTFRGLLSSPDRALSEKCDALFGLKSALKQELERRFDTIGSVL